MIADPRSRPADTEETAVFHPAPLATLPPDSEAHFELYIAIPGRSGVRYHLYKSANIELTGVKRRELIAKGIDTLFIKERDIEAYHTFVDKTIGKMLLSATTPPEKKSEILYTTTSAIVRSTFERPDSPVLVNTNRKLMAHSVALLASEPAMVRTMAALFALDYSLYTHSVHVAVLGTGLLLETGHKNEEELRDLSLGLLLHDIGKSRVPTYILNKPGMLSVSELKQLERHPEHGVSLMQCHQQLVPMALEIIHDHHEKLNGNGYPRRLPSARISLPTRICSVVDIYDALTSHRSYKPAMRGFDAMTFIHQRMSQELDGEMLRLLAYVMGPSNRSGVYASQLVKKLQEQPIM
ncbi:HD domain-containing protein [candidate division KSB1 bacterium]|nr:HD domain-containing protein [candidate division KSB1 bacterium]